MEVAKDKVMVAFSGGIDSATLVQLALSTGHEVKTVRFQYGSKQLRAESFACEKLVEFFRTFPLYRGDEPVSILPPKAWLKSPMLDWQNAVPEGNYFDEAMKQTVVPGRNMVFASLLAGIAWSEGYEHIWMGIQAGDTPRSLYPDCRPEFVSAMRQAAFYATDGKVLLQTPFLHTSKSSIIEQAQKLRVPLQLTWSCYTAGPKACGKCGACDKRLKAFHELKIVDPLEYVGN